MVQSSRWDLSLSSQHPISTNADFAKLPHRVLRQHMQSMWPDHRKDWITDSCYYGNYHSDPRNVYTALQGSPARPSVRLNC